MAGRPTKAGKLPVERQFSSGGIVYRETGGGIEVVIATRLTTGATRTTREGKKIWCLPKGTVETGESPEDTAQREVREETGITGRIERKLGDITYWYQSRDQGVRYFKTVSFFLMSYVSGDTADHDRELDEVTWVPLEEAEMRLGYPGERDMMARAREALLPTVTGQSPRSP